MTIILFKILMALEFLVCLMLIGIILIQRSKGQGAGLSFGGGAEAIFGAHMGNVLTRFTVILGIVFLVNTTVLAVWRPAGPAVSDSLVIQNTAKPAATSSRQAAPATVVEDEDLYSVLESVMPDAPAPVTVTATVTEPVTVTVEEAAEDAVEPVDAVDAVDEEAAENAVEPVEPADAE